MSLLNNNAKKGDKKDKKNIANAANAKFAAKPGKSVAFAKKPMKTGGTRGS